MINILRTVKSKVSRTVGTKILTIKFTKLMKGNLRLIYLRIMFRYTELEEMIPSGEMYNSRFKSDQLKF